MLELNGGEELGPLVRIVCTKDPKISFNFLVGLFRLPISLWMISSGEADIVFKDSSEFPSESSGELWAVVRDKGIVESKVFEHVVKKELSNSVRVHSFRARS